MLSKRYSPPSFALGYECDRDALHFPRPARDRVLDPGTAPALSNCVHSAGIALKRASTFFPHAPTTESSPKNTTATYKLK